MSEQRKCIANGCDVPTKDVDLLCVPCQSELRQALAEMPALLDELDTTLTRQARMSDASDGGRSAEKPLPFHVTASEVLIDLRVYLVGWVKDLANDDPARYPTDDLVAMSAWLLARLGDIARHEAADDIHDEIVTTVRQAWRVVDRFPDLEFVGVCSECGARLYVKPGEPTVTCRECNASYETTVVKADLWSQLQDVLMTVSEIVHWGVRLRYIDDEKRTRNLLDQWVARGRLVHHGMNTLGRRLYPFGDVITRAMTAQSERSNSTRISVAG